MLKMVSICDVVSFRYPCQLWVSADFWYILGVWFIEKIFRLDVAFIKIIEKLSFVSEIDQL